MSPNALLIRRGNSKKVRDAIVVFKEMDTGLGSPNGLVRWTGYRFVVWQSLRCVFRAPACALQSINQSNIYSADIPGKAGLSGATAKSVFNSKIEETVP